MYKVIPGVLYNAGKQTEDVVPEGTEYDASMPSPARYHNSGLLGMNAKQRKRIWNFQRLSHLMNFGEQFHPDSEDARHTLSKQLSIMVMSGGQAKNIIDAREQIQRLYTIAKELYDEVHHLMADPEGVYTYEITREDRPQWEKIRGDLFAFVQELAGRGAIGCSEPMKTAASERMRAKLEVKLLPKLNAEIPRWAERLRFLHSDVLKYAEPLRLLLEKDAMEDAEPSQGAQAAEEDFEEWEAPADSNPRPRGEELELLKAMGWTGR